MKLTDKQIAIQLRKPQGEYARVVGSEMSRKNRAMIEPAMDALNINEGCSVLEIGFGNGEHINDLFSDGKNFRYWGVDISQEMVTEAQKNCSALIKEEKVILSCTDGHTLPFGMFSFNSVFSINTIYFWDDASAYLKEINRVLVPGGQLVLSFGTKKFMKHLPFTRYGFKLYNPDEIWEILSNTGFEVNTMKIMVDSVESASGNVVKREFCVTEAIRAENGMQ